MSWWAVAGLNRGDLLLSKADEGKDYLKRRGEEALGSANELIDKGKDAIARQKDQLQAAVEAGKQAYREVVEGSEATHQGA